MVTLNDAIGYFLLSRRADGVAPSTVRWYESVLHAMAEHFGDVPLTALHTHDLRAYIVELRERGQRYVKGTQKPAQEGGLSRASVNAYITAMRAFWSWAAAEYDLPANPAKAIRRGKTSSPEPKAISESDYVALFDATGDDAVGVRNRAILAFFADTGCRLGGLLSLTWRSLYLADRQAYLVEKGDRRRMVYYTQFTAHLLELWLAARQGLAKPDVEQVFVSVTGSPLTASGIHEMLKRLKRKAGVKGRVNPHSFRHNFAREYIRSGGDVVTLARILGHRDLSTTMAYYAVFSDEELGEFHRKHSPMNYLKQQMYNRYNNGEEESDT